ncbi:hypothetical protein PF007_g14021 [Phytophthora fragariae]|nr:hypothetical protein PF007_g14021 [Phytophthora fragariae]
MADKDRCVQWMECDVLDNGEKGLFGRTVDHFPSLFRSADRRVNMNKARDWWKKRSALQLALEDGRQHKYARSAMGGRHQLVLKAISGCGRKLDAHWDWLYPQLLQEFERLRRAGLKLSSRLLIDMATTMIEDSPHEVFNKATGLVLKDKKQVSDVKMAQIEQSVTHHLGTLKRMFDDEVLDPSQQFNMDESHFVIDLDDSKTLDFRGADKAVKELRCACCFEVDRMQGFCAQC